MRRRVMRDTSSVVLSAISALALAIAVSACGSSSKSQTEITDVGDILANFGINQVSGVDHEGSPLADRANAAATFFSGVATTVEFKGGKVEIVDPQENVTELDLLHNTFGAPYYSADLAAPIAFDQSYTFRLTLASGKVIENLVTTPSQVPQITVPAPAGTISKSAPTTTVSWIGTGPGSIQVIISPDEPDTGISNIFHLGGTLVLDVGTTNLVPQNLENVTVGDNVLTLVRGRVVPANGFAVGSLVGAFLLFSEPVVVTE